MLIEGAWGVGCGTPCWRHAEVSAPDGALRLVGPLRSPVLRWPVAPNCRSLADRAAGHAARLFHATFSASRAGRGNWSSSMRGGTGAVLAHCPAAKRGGAAGSSAAPATGRRGDEHALERCARGRTSPTVAIRGRLRCAGRARRDAGSRLNWPSAWPNVGYMKTGSIFPTRCGTHQYIRAVTYPGRRLLLPNATIAKSCLSRPRTRGRYAACCGLPLACWQFGGYAFFFLFLSLACLADEHGGLEEGERVKALCGDPKAPFFAVLPGLPPW